MKEYTAERAILMIILGAILSLSCDSASLKKKIDELAAYRAPAARALLARVPALLPGDPEMAAVIESTVAETFADRLAEGTGETDLANSECRAKDPSKCPYHGGKQADDIGETAIATRGRDFNSRSREGATGGTEHLDIQKDGSVYRGSIPDSVVKEQKAF